MGKTSKLYRIAAALFVASCLGNATAQNSSLYFMKWNPQQHQFNPAFQPKGKFYIGMPTLSNLSIEGGNSDLVFSDIFKNVTVDGEKKTVLFLDKNAPKGSVNHFLGQMNNGTRIFYDQRLNIIDFGFRLRNSQYVTFGIANRASASTLVPKSLFELALKGVKEGQTYKMDGKNLAADALLYSEIALGYSRPINEDLTVGAKFKYLYGHGNLHSNFKNLTITGNEDLWRIGGDAEIETSVPGLKIKEKEDGQIDDLDFDFDEDNIKDYAKPQGKGFAVDLGADYKLNKNITLSASILDLGLIKWSENINRIKKVNDFEWDGIEYDFNNDTIDYGEKYEDMLDAMFRVDHSSKAYKTSLNTKFTAGGEYSLWKDRLGLGLLYRGQLYRGVLYGNGVASANFRPGRHFSATLTYDLFDKEWNNVGAGINLNAGPINLFCMFDNIPMKFAKSDEVLIPSNLRDFRFEMGMNLLFGYGKKHDKKNLVSEEIAPDSSLVEAAKTEVITDIVNDDNVTESANEAVKVESIKDTIAPAVKEEVKAEPVKVEPAPAKKEEVKAETVKVEPTPAKKEEVMVETVKVEPTPAKKEEVKAETVKVEPTPTKKEEVKAETVKVEPTPAKKEEVKAETVKVEPAPAKKEEVKTEPVKVEPTPAVKEEVKTEPVKVEPTPAVKEEVKAEPVKVEPAPAKKEEVKTEPVKVEPTPAVKEEVKTEPVKVEPTPAKKEEVKTEPVKVEPTPAKKEEVVTNEVVNQDIAIHTEGLPTNLRNLSQEARYGIKFLNSKDLIALDPSSKSTLNKIVAEMEANPQISAEVHSHSVLVKDKDYTYFLTEERAKVICGYLIDKGIDPKRLKPVGMGNDKPIASGNTEMAKKVNNRTEFVFFK